MGGLTRVGKIANMRPWTSGREFMAQWNGMELKDKRVLVVGLGRSGAASAFFLQDHGAKVTVSDEKSEAQLQNEIAALLDRGVSIETGRHGDRTFPDQHLIVVT